MVFVTFESIVASLWYRRFCLSCAADVVLFIDHAWLKTHEYLIPHSHMYALMVVSRWTNTF